MVKINVLCEYSWLPIMEKAIAQNANVMVDIRVFPDCAIMYSRNVSNYNIDKLLDDENNIVVFAGAYTSFFASYASDRIIVYNSLLAPKSSYFKKYMRKDIWLSSYVRFQKEKKSKNSLMKLRLDRIYNYIRACNKSVVVVGDENDIDLIRSRFKDYEKCVGELILKEKDGILYSVEDDLQSFWDLKINKDETIFVISAYKNTVKTIGFLIDLGIPESNIVSLISAYEAGGVIFTDYDVDLGFTWRGEKGFPGIEIFGDVDHADIKILTLGGSTTDPHQTNLKSWSEYMYDFLAEYGLNVSVICGGVGAYTCQQECLKLIRDGLSFNPDIVISYSGVNDFFSNYYDRKTPFVNKYQVNLLERALQKRLIKNILQPANPWGVKAISSGMAARKDIERQDSWFYSQKIMHDVCVGAGIEYIGIYQPNNMPRVSDMQKKGYSSQEQMLKKLTEYDWLLDFSGIFDNYNSVFYDCVHVYEKGNRIIARRIIPYVLKRLELSYDKEMKNIMKGN